MAGRKQSGDDFLLGGRALPLFLTLGTTVATMVGTGSSMGAAGKAYTGGWTGCLFGIGAFWGISAVALLFAPVREYRFMTMAEELSSYVGADRWVTNAVSVFTFLSSVGWLGLHIVGGGAYLHSVTGVDPVLAKSLIALGFGIYAVIGGYRAVVWTDTIQAVVLFAGFVLTAGYAFDGVGGWEGLREVNAQLTAKSPTSPLHAVSLVVAVGIGVLATPAYRQRIYSGNTVPDIRRAFVLSGLLSLGFSVLPTIIGMAAFHADPELTESNQAFPMMATQVLPVWLGLVVLISGLSATMSSASSDAISGVTTVVRDLYPAAMGQMPPGKRVVRYSRFALVVTVTLALGMALLAGNIMDYIIDIIALFVTGMCTCGILGRLWPRFNAWGALSALAGASCTALIFWIRKDWTEFWVNSVIPSLAVSFIAGILVTLVTKPDRMTHEETLTLLKNEREEMAAE